jgi:hypothetical protein
MFCQSELQFKRIHYVEIVRHAERHGFTFTEVDAALDRLVESGVALQHDGSMYELTPRRRT